MAKVLTVIENVPVYVDGDNLWFTAKAAIDNDGSNNSQHDPNWQRDTSLHYPLRGKEGSLPIDANKVPYIVVPPAIIDGVAGVVLGCQAFVTYKGNRIPAVVADVGPHKKLGEISVKCAMNLEIPSTLSKEVGVDEHEVYYEIFAGVPAQIDGIIYELQPKV